MLNEKKERNQQQQPIRMIFVQRRWQWPRKLWISGTVGVRWG